MPKITVLPHAELCPEGATFDAPAGSSLLDALLNNGVHIGHACERACACTTCHVIVRQGFDTLDDPSEDEEDTLDKAWGLEQTSRLSCQTKIGTQDLEIQIPRYNMNHAQEG
jgi:2Fe-2S ferredoxin